MLVPSLPNSALMINAGAPIGDTSLRINGNNSAYVFKNFENTGNRLTFTLSMWVKRSRVTQGATSLFSTSVTAGSNYSAIEFNAHGQLQLVNNGTVIARTTNSYNDTTNHYNVHIQFNSTASIQNDRIMFTVNGIRQALEVNTIAQNFSFPFNVRNQYHYIFRRDSVATTGQNDGYISFIRFIDGLSVPFTEFGRHRVSAGIVIPKEYKGEYGNNGFFLIFEEVNFSVRPGFEIEVLLVGAGGAGGGGDGPGRGHPWGSGGGSGSAVLFKRTVNITDSLVIFVGRGGAGAGATHTGRHGGAGGESAVAPGGGGREAQGWGASGGGGGGGAGTFIRLADGTFLAIAGAGAGGNGGQEGWKHQWGGAGGDTQPNGNTGNMNGGPGDPTYQDGGHGGGGSGLLGGNGQKNTGTNPGYLPAGGGTSLVPSGGTLYKGNGGMGWLAAWPSTSGASTYDPNYGRAVTVPNASNFGYTNQGQGGRGGYGDWGSGSAGENGVAFIRYPGTIQRATGGSISIINGYTVHRFTALQTTFLVTS